MSRILLKRFGNIFQLQRSLNVSSVRRRETVSSDIAIDTRLSSFGKKSTTELIRSYIILSASSRSYIARNSEMLIRTGRTLISRPIFDAIMRHTFYNQFVCGDTLDSIKRAAEDLKTRKLHMMLLMVDEVGLEDDNNVPFDANAVKFIQLLRLARDIGNHTAGQLRMSAFVKPLSLVSLTRCLENIEPQEKSKLYKLVGASMANEHADVELCKYLQQINVLSDSDGVEFCRALKAIYRVAKSACENKIRIFVDGELDCMNPAILMLAVGMMQHANVDDVAWIFGTYQAYLKKTEGRVDFDLQYCRANHFKFALKLVRGAYMDTERAMAGATESAPVWETYELTNQNYNKIALKMLDCFSQHDAGSIITATHNWETISKAVDKYSTLYKTKPHVAMFGQTWGFTDYISEWLATNGYFVYQSVAYGTVAAALPFLARRAQENFSMLQRGIVDRHAIKMELKRRLLRIQ